jgi:pimeloyl-ACP methyl ester carboxylesterase
MTAIHVKGRPIRTGYAGRALRRGALFLLLAATILPLLGFVYQNAAIAIDSLRFQPPGRLVAVNGRRLHLHCLGQGSPTIVLDHAGGGLALEWALVQPLLAHHTRVCAYDRAGFGWSDPQDGPGDLHRMTADLATLLAAAGESAPYVLVGHSYGARVVRLFAATHPDLTAGLVLLDPAIDYADPRYPSDLHTQRAEEQRMLAMVGALAPFGVVRLVQPVIDAGLLGDMPQDVQAAMRSFEAGNQLWQTIAADAPTVHAAAPDLQVRNLGDLPLLVISAGQPDDHVRRAWSAANADLAQLSSRGQHLPIGGATHMSLVFDRLHAEQVAAAILALIQARQGNTR